MCEYNHSFVPINDSDVKTGINADNNEASNDENEEDKYEADMNNKYATLGYDDFGIIFNDGPIEYD